MSLHRSLKTKSGALEAHRNVLTRAERITKLADMGTFDPERDTPIHLPKVRNTMVSTGTNKKAAAAPEEEAEAEAEAGASRE